MLYSFYSIVPSVSPNVSWYNLSSTSIKVEGFEIPPPLRNGIVLGYTIYFWKQSEGPSADTNVSVERLIKMFEDLEKFTLYCGQVAAHTRVGEGPRSSVECIRTSEDGRSLFYCRNIEIRFIYLLI